MMIGCRQKTGTGNVPKIYLDMADHADDDDGLGQITGMGKVKQMIMMMMMGWVIYLGKARFKNLPGDD